MSIPIKCQTHTAVMGENLGQGSKSAATVCSMSLSKSTDRYFRDSQHEVSYGSVVLAPMLFQDDSMRLTTTVEGARDGCTRFEKIMDSKTLDVNIDKSVYLIVAKKSNVERIRAEITKRQLCYKGSVLKEKLTEKWLGQVINAAGIKESTMSTIQERKYRIHNIIHETKAIVEDCRMNKIGGLKCSKEIWELAILPSLLNNAEVWHIQDQKIQKSLEDFQFLFYRGILALPKSCPLPALAYESDSQLIKYRVYNKIINFVKHVHCHDEESNLSKQILLKQLANDWPLARTV